MKLQNPLCKCLSPSTVLQKTYIQWQKCYSLSSIFFFWFSLSPSILQNLEQNVTEDVKEDEVTISEFGISFAHASATGHAR